ncbi:hypothetical protein ENKNEFLB_03634 [Nocardioides aquaticus]|jgi:hypothetical protein|uniref:DUF2505 domain-containing protein n=2 Tax=Nocardioides aquaticus TaxID=160826 RepID=A0ABX8ENL7_9ACTN|nr:hypothetical protein ENKNEFLB_03634 [Nocardioides aquaticus]
MMCAMTKRITHDLTYDAPLESVAAMLGDKAFREEVCDAQHVLSHDVTVTSPGSGPKTVTIDQKQSARGLPSFATKIVGDSIHIVQEEDWTSSSEAVVTVVIPGKPGDMRGTARLSESGGVTTETVVLDVKVSIPLVGGKIEGLVADMLLKALKVENRVGRDYLSR